MADFKSDIIDMIKYELTAYEKSEIMNAFLEYLNSYESYNVESLLTNYITSSRFLDIIFNSFNFSSYIEEKIDILLEQKFDSLLEKHKVPRKTETTDILDNEPRRIKL